MPRIVPPAIRGVPDRHERWPEPSPVTNHIGLFEKVNPYAFHLPQRFHRLNQTAPFVARKIDLAAIPSDDALRIRAKAGEKHEHLLCGGILSLVKNNKRLAEGSSPHVSREGQFR